MQMPSTRNMDTMPFTLPIDWLELPPFDLIDRMEEWGAANLRVNGPKTAALGTYTRETQTTGGQAPAVGQFWIIYHGDYDTGRANIEVQIRDTLEEVTRVFHMRNDTLTAGRVVDFQLDSECVRVGTDKKEWREILSTGMRKKELDDSAPPAVRSDVLFAQCAVMARRLSEWLASNLLVIEERGEEPTTINPALEHFLRINLLWYALVPTAYEEAKKHLNDPDIVSPPNYRNMHAAFGNVKTMLRRGKRISTPEQIALYERLKASVEYTQKIDPSERPIHASSLVGIQTRWINEVSELVKKFAK